VMADDLYLHADIDDQGRLMLYDQHGRQVRGIVSAGYHIGSDSYTHVVADIELWGTDGSPMSDGQVASPAHRFGGKSWR